MMGNMSETEGLYDGKNVRGYMTGKTSDTIK